MNNLSKPRFLALLALALVALASMAVQAGAHGRGDRSARIDSDRDSASNRCERQAGLDSANTDTDGNGTIDGLEDSDSDGANNAAESRMRTNCGVANKRFKIKNATVVSFSEEAGLTLKIGKRGLVTGAVSSKLVCEQDDLSDSTDETDPTLARHGDDDEAGDDRGGRGRGEDDRAGDDRGDDDRGGRDRGGRGEDDGPDTVACTTADLTEGAEVVAAKFKKGAFTKIHLAAADAGDF